MVQRDKTVQDLLIKVPRPSSDRLRINGKKSPLRKHDTLRVLVTKDLAPQLGRGTVRLQKPAWLLLA